MAKYIGPKCRLSRREGVDLQHKSRSRAFESKCKADKPPGQFGSKVGRKATDYSLQLRMKQLIKRYYGILERQFHKYYEMADKSKGSTGETLLNLLESRLDNVVYRLGFASTRAEARQLVNHKSVMVNNKIINIPSYLLKPNDEISIKPKSKNQQRIIASLDYAEKTSVPEWLTLNTKNMSGSFNRHLEATEFPPEFQIHLVVELYSK